MQPLRHLEDFFVGGDDEIGIDVDLAELVLDHGDAVAVLSRQDVVEQRRLAGAEEAGEDRHRDLFRGRCFVEHRVHAGMGSQRGAASGAAVRAFSASASSTWSGVIG